MTDLSINVTDSAEPRIDVGAAGRGAPACGSTTTLSTNAVRTKRSRVCRLFAVPADDLPVAEFAFPGPLRDQLVAAILAGEKTTTSAAVGVGDVGAHGQLRDAIRLNQHWFR
jgi:hypothetical protein